MNFEKLDEYILELQNYQEGRYEYRTLTSKFDITKAIENGKKIVFLKNKLGAKIYLILGGIFLVLGLILAIIFSVNILIFSIIFGIFGAFGLAFIITGLFKMRTSFLVLGPEGIVYKLRGGSIKGFKWEDISLDLGGTISIQIHISMPNGDFIKLAPGDYCSEEFPKSKSHIVFNLHMFTFMLHYKWGKFKPQEINPEEDKQQAKKDINSAENTNIVNDYSLEDLSKEYYKYKEKKYKFGKYGTREQILDEFSKGKIFVLKGGLRIVDWTFVIVFLAIGLIAGIPLSFFYIGLGVFMFCFWAFFASIFFIKLRNLLVISPLGVFYRKILSSGVFSWNNVNNVKGSIRTYRGFSWAEVTIYITYGRKIKFGSNAYLNKEFPKKVKMEMFFTLFYIYFQRGKKKISQSSIQKSVSYSQLKEQLLSPRPKSEVSQLKTEELQPILPISDKKEEKSKINSNSQSTKFPPISELMQKIRSPIPKIKTSQLINGESQPTTSISDKEEEKSDITLYICEYCGFKLTSKVNFCPECGKELIFF